MMEGNKTKNTDTTYTHRWMCDTEMLDKYGQELWCKQTLQPLMSTTGKVAGRQSSLKHTFCSTYLRSLVTTLLKAYSHAYIFITLIPVMTSFITRTRLSVT